MTIKLEIHICDQRRSYVATFATEDQALEFIERKSVGTDAHPYGNHVFHEIETHPLPATATRLYDVLYPLCEHNMRTFCYGPSHWASDEEIRQGW